MLLCEGDHELAEVILPNTAPPVKPAIVIGGVRFDLAMGRPPNTAIGLAFDGMRVATARRTGWLWPRYDVDVVPDVAEDGPLVFTVRASFARRSHVVETDGDRVGAIGMVGITSKLSIDIAEAVPVLVQAFLLTAVIDSIRSLSSA